MKAVRPRKDLTVVRLVQPEQEVKRYELRAYVQVGTTELGMDFLNVSGGGPLHEN
jgi:hypothetical protein